MQTQPPRSRGRGRWIRRAAIAAVLLIALAGIGVYFGAPAWLGTSSGRAFVAGKVEDSYGVPITIDSLHADWTTSIAARSVRAHRADGEQAAELDVSADIGLWQLLMGADQSIGAHVSGAVNATLRDDGSLHIVDLKAPATSAAPSPQGGADRGGPRMQLTIDALDVNLRDDAGRRVVRIHPLNANVNVEPGVAPALSLRGEVQFQTQRGSFEAKGSLPNLFSPRGQLQPQRAQLMLDATVEDLPTDLIDMLLNLKGMLTATVGPTMRAEFLAEQFSRSTGFLTADVTTPQGSLQAKVKGRDRGLIITQNQPLTAELSITHELRQKLLSRIHPLLADVRATEQPLRVVVRKATIPTDGDIGRLDADLTITIGKVEFDSGSLTLNVLRAFGRSQEIVPGEIEPIEVKVRRGVVTYDRFAVHIQHFTMRYEGSVDLVKRTVDLRTEIPLSGLAHSFHELEGFADDIVVPIETTGPLDRPVTKAQFDAIAEQALQGRLGDLLRDVLPKELRDRLAEPRPPDAPRP